MAELQESERGWPHRPGDIIGTGVVLLVVFEAGLAVGKWFL